MIKGIFDVLAAKRARKDQRTLAELDVTSEIRRAEIEAGTHHEGRLWDRITQLEQRVDQAHADCQQQIVTAIAKEAADCDERVNRKLRSQAAQLRAEFKRGIAEASEVTHE